MNSDPLTNQITSNSIGNVTQKVVLTSNSNEYEVPLYCFVSKEHLTNPSKPVSSRSAVELHAYATRANVKDHNGRIRDYRRAGTDLVGSRIYFPAHTMEVPPLRVWQEADKAAESTGRVVIISIHMVCRLPSANAEAWFDMINRYVQEHIVSMELIVEAAVHAPLDTSPHVHFQISCRKWTSQQTFTNQIANATSKATRMKWQQGWVNIMAAYKTNS